MLSAVALRTDFSASELRRRAKRSNDNNQSRRCRWRRSLFTFDIKGGLDSGKRFYDALKLVTRLVNIGDAKSLACHPASTTHRQMSRDEQRQTGVLPETIRLSIGIEHIDDIIADIDQALDRASI
jgi:O-acetylhomoserine (thiol)-lyase